MPNCTCDPNALHGAGCQVIKEFRMTPAEHQAAYREEIARHLSRLGQSPVDVPRRLQKLGVPFDVILAIRAPRQRLALDWAKKFILAPKEVIRFLVLAGPRGIGKSVAAGWALADAVKRYDWNAAPSGGRQWEPFVWAKAADIASVTEFGRVDPDWLEGLRRCRLLVVDDMGHEATAPGLTALRDVLIARHEKRFPTVLTSNLTPQKFQERYGDSWFDRMASASMFPVLGEEKSMRKRPEVRP